MSLIESRFDARSTAFEVVESHDLQGKKAIVTGAGSGIGIETARALAAAGAEVVLAVRNVAATQALIASGDDARRRMKVDQLDLADPRSVRSFAERHGHEPLHILVNNAGVMATPLRWLDTGFEMQIGVNHFGHFLLTQLLADALERGAPARVVSLTSIAHVQSPIHFDDLHFRHRPYDKWQAYAQSKTANSLFAVELTRRWQERGITANAVMPGGIMTNLQRELEKSEMRALGFIDAEDRPHPMFKSPEQGAATSVWAAVGPELAGIGGLYLEDCRQASPWTEQSPYEGYAPHALDPGEAERLWNVSVEELKALN